MDTQTHSADWFGEQRDYWWNRDFLDLMAVRWKLSEASSLADVGCGLGHWSQLLYPYLRSPAKLTGIDREARWVVEAELRFQRAFPKTTPDHYTFLQGDAGKLPLPDSSFDVVTCQTVLMHLKEPLEALRDYDKPGQRALLQQESEWKLNGAGPWDQAELLRHYLLGGGTEKAFEEVFAELSQKYEAEQRAIETGTFHAGYGAVAYLVSGRKGEDRGRSRSAAA